MKLPHAAQSAPRAVLAKAPPSLGYRPPPTRWRAAGDFAIGLAFWGAFCALAAHYVGLIG